jgi:predicted nucleotidyltransferase
MSALPEAVIEAHQDAVEAHHRFSKVTFRGEPWDLSHLDALVLRADIGDKKKSPGAELLVNVVALFSCHCFTHSVESDSRLPIPLDEVFYDGREDRVLNAERYHLSKRYLPDLIRELGERTIRVAGPQPNFVSFEVTDSSGREVRYAVFFEVERCKKQKRRLILRVQSAYPMDEVPQRLAKAGKVNLPVLLRAAYEGRKIKG